MVPWTIVEKKEQGSANSVYNFRQLHVHPIIQKGAMKT